MSCQGKNLSVTLQKGNKIGADGRLNEEELEMFKKLLAVLLAAMLLLTVVPALAVNEVAGELTIWVRTN